MELSKPIYKISKEIGVETNRILIACKTLGISAKASTKRLNSEEIENIINYFNSGRNASSETIDIGNKKSEKVNKVNSIKKENQYLETIYFPNRLIG
tara:strand:- start:2940 stop:3230 length:291 start_codon:yes stop_codon:yes gene_type:complete